MTRLLTVLAGVVGTLGVALWAMSAHRAGSDILSTAANFLLLHASAFLALALVAHVRLLARGWLMLAAGLLITGLALFCGDLSARVFLGTRIFPMAAPIGGTLLLTGWLALAFGGLVSRPPRG